jgi:LacI family transcriptional regulator
VTATRDDVARLAGVSSATVSYVVNNGPRNVKEMTRQKVLRAIEQLSYQPSAVARSLRTKKTLTIGVIVSDILNPVLSAVAKGIEDKILPLSYGMILCNSDEDPDRELTFLNMLLSKQVDGIILMPTCENVRFLLSLAEEKFPLVLLDRSIEGMGVDNLLFDNETGAYQATRHLLEQGHQRIGLVSLPMHLTPGHERVSGYDRALREAGLPYDPALVIEGSFKAEKGPKLAEPLFSLRDPPTAILISSNRLFIGVLEYVKEHHINIPGDIAVVVFDDVPYFSYSSPSITAVRSDADAFGQQAAGLLEQAITLDGSHQGKVIRFPTELVIRESSVGFQK